MPFGTRIHLRPRGGPRGRIHALLLMSDCDPAMLSLVVPVYNEQDNVLPLYERATKALEQRLAEYEVILVDGHA